MESDIRRQTHINLIVSILILIISIAGGLSDLLTSSLGGMKAFTPLRGAQAAWNAKTWSERDRTGRVIDISTPRGPGRPKERMTNKKIYLHPSHCQHNHSLVDPSLAWDKKHLLTSQIFYRRGEILQLISWGQLLTQVVGNPPNLTWSRILFSNWLWWDFSAIKLVPPLLGVNMFQ